MHCEVTYGFLYSGWMSQMLADTDWQTEMFLFNITEEWQEDHLCFWWFLPKAGSSVLISHLTALRVPVNPHLLLLCFFKAEILKRPNWFRSSLNSYSLHCCMHVNSFTVSLRLTVWLYYYVTYDTCCQTCVHLVLNTNLSCSRDQSNKLLVPVSCQCWQLCSSVALHAPLFILQ